MIKYNTKPNEGAISNELREAVRKAWRSPKHQITIDGHLFNIVLQSRPVSFITGPQDAPVTKKAVEKWLVVRRADGALVPTYSIEYERMGNLRAK